MAEGYEKVQDYLKNKSPSLSISRISQLARDKFVALAKEEFCDDYGWTLTSLMERCDYNEAMKSIIAELYDINDRLSKLEGSKKDNIKIMADGKTEKVIKNG